MDRVQAASFMVLDRPLLAQMAIATVLVSSAAALNSAGIAAPVSHVGFDGTAASGVSDVPQLLSASPATEAPAEIELAAPHFAEAPAPLHNLVASDAAIPAPQPHGLVLEVAPKRGPASVPAILTPPAIEVPAAAPVVSAPPLETATAAPADLAAGPAAVPLRLVSPPDLRGFDLAQVGRAVKQASPELAEGSAKPAGPSKLEVFGSKSSIVGDTIFHQLTVSIAGSDGKSVDVRIGGDMKPSLKVGDLLALVSDRMDPDSAARFAAASSAGEYVSLATLRAAGFDVAYNAGADSISITVAQ